MIQILEQYFGPKETVKSLQQACYDRVKQDNESLVEFLQLIQLYDRAVDKATKQRHKLSRFCEISH